MAGPRSRTKAVQVQGQTSDEKIARIDATVDYLKDESTLMREQLQSMNQTLAVNTEQLKVHIEGVKLAREQNTILKADVDSRFLQRDEELKPVHKHVTQVSFLTKVFMWGIALPGAVYYCIQIFRSVKGM
jgi:hypothetical protein